MTKEKDTFEKKLERLNEIVLKIENETLPLDESLKLYEEGNALLKELKATLDEAKKNVGKFVKIDDKSQIEK